MARKNTDKRRYPVPRGKKKGCLGRDGTYSRANCDENDYYSQGVGEV